MGLKEVIFGGNARHMKQTADNACSGSIQKWLPVLDIVSGVIVTKDGRYIKVLEVLPINFHLKSPLDKQNIIFYYASYLKVAPNSLQIRVITQKADLDGYMEQMRRYHREEENEQCRAMIEDNIAEVSYIAATQAISRRFLLVFQLEPQMRPRSLTRQAIAERLNEEAETARRYLDLCGLEVLTPPYADNAVLELLYELLNKRTARRVKLPPGVFDMITPVLGIFETPEGA